MSDTTTNVSTTPSRGAAGAPDVSPLGPMMQVADALRESGALPPSNTAGRIAPKVDLSAPIRELALRLGQLCAPRNIFLRGGTEVVTVDDVTGMAHPMTPARFSGWVEEWAAMDTSRLAQRRNRDSLQVGEAQQILEQDTFRRCLRPLNGINTMRLPVRRKATGAWEFLEAGWDEETGIYTVDLLPYPMDWTHAQAVEFLDEHGEEYPFSWGDEERAGRPMQMCRSWSVVVAGMLGMYLRTNWIGHPKPMVIGLSNQPGTGKTTLIAMIVAATCGQCFDNKFPRADKDLDDELDSVCLAQQPYVFFDDLGRHLFSHRLNAFITSTWRSGRIKGKPDMFVLPNVTQLFATGRDVEVDDNLARRALIFEMFLAGEVQGRRFRKVIDIAYLTRRDTREKFLAAMCALVRHAAPCLQRIASGDSTPPDVAVLQTFTEYTRTVGTMMVLAGYTDPCVPPSLSAGGNTEDEEMRTLLVAIADAVEASGHYTRQEMFERARELGLLEDVVGLKEEKVDASMTKRWGRLLQKWRGRELQRSDGRMFRFARRRQKRGMAYDVEVLGE